MIEEKNQIIPNQIIPQYIIVYMMLDTDIVLIAYEESVVSANISLCVISLATSFARFPSAKYKDAWL